MAKIASHLPRFRNARTPATAFLPAAHRVQWGAAALSLALLFGASPALSGPAQTDGAGTGCWSPGAAPDLFSWSDTPGIACRDAADGSATAQTPPAAVTAQRPPQATDDSKGTAEITFSGSAYAGIATSF